MEVIATKAAPAAVGPYSQAIAVDSFLFASGQIAIDPATGEMVQTSIEAETQRIMDNIAAILKEAGLDFGKVVKTTIFATDIAYFGAINGVYAQAFVSAPPARSFVQVAALPKGARVEIEVIAHK